MRLEGGMGLEGGTRLEGGMLDVRLGAGSLAALPPRERAAGALGRPGFEGPAAELAALLGAAFLGEAFSTAFLAVSRFGAAFLGASFFGAAFLGVAFLVAAFLAGRCAVVLPATGFFAPAFLTAFLGAAFLLAALGGFFAATFLEAVFLAPPFLAAGLAAGFFFAFFALLVVDVRFVLAFAARALAFLFGFLAEAVFLVLTGFCCSLAADRAVT